MPVSPPSEHPTDPVAALSGSWFGAGLSPEAMARLAGIAELRDIAPETELTREGQVTEVPERGMVTILTVEPGDIVGWSALVPPHRASSTAIAIEPVHALFLDGDQLRALLRGDHALAASVYPRVLQAVGRRLTATRLQLLDLFAREEWSRREIQPW
jgi:CRP/FNR family cyclic AMP-dependent transcriptional regulator